MSTFRRMTAYRLALVLFALFIFVSASAADGADGDLFPWDDELDAEIGSCAMIDQCAGAYTAKRFAYNNDTFRNDGCGPATLTNMLTVAFGVTDMEQANAVLLDLMTMMADFHDPVHQGINVNRISRFVEPECDGYEALTDLKRRFGGSVVGSSKKIGLNYLKKQTAEAFASGEPVAVLGRFTVHGNWTEVIEICEWLCEEGREDARVVFGWMGSGSLSMKTPFRFGSDGHYVTLCINPAAFLEKGTVYVIDSWPQLLPGEKDIPGYFHGAYAMRADLQKTNFRGHYTYRHVSPCAVKCVPKDDAWADILALREKAGTASGRKSYLRGFARMCNYIGVFGTGVILVVIP